MAPIETTNEDAPPPVPGDYLHDDVQAVSEYRSVSSAAVLAAAVGVSSLAAIFTDSLLFLPLLGTVVALIALRRIAGGEGRLVGRTAAVVGLALSVAVGVGILTRDFTSQRALAGQASPWAVEWCGLVMDGQLEAALELTRPLESRRMFDESLEEYYRTNEVGQEELEKFQADPVIALLTGASKGARVVPGKVIGWQRESSGDYTIAEAFTLVDPGEATGETFHLQLHKTGPAKQIPGSWRVGSYVLAL